MKEVRMTVEELLQRSGVLDEFQYEQEEFTRRVGAAIFSAAYGLTLEEARSAVDEHYRKLGK